jgi:hypothetical protein
VASKVIFHDCTENYSFKGQRSLLDLIPPHKTLFKVDRGKGLPIGNLTSQFFANVYLNELDQFVKRQLGCRYYLRYCDDFLLLSDSREQLLSWHEAIDEFLSDRLMLELNLGQYRLCPVSSGIDFLGYIVRRKYVLVRRRVVNHFREKLEYFDRRLACRRKGGAGENEMSAVVSGCLDRPQGRAPTEVPRDVGARPRGRCVGEVASWRYHPRTMEQFRAMVNSYLGHMRWASSFNLISSLFVRYPVLRAAFYLEDGRLIPRYLPGVQAGNIRRQYEWWTQHGMKYRADEETSPVSPAGAGSHEHWHFRGSQPPLAIRACSHSDILVFFKIGRYYEFYGEQALCAQNVMGLKPRPGLRGFRHGCGFHRKWLSRYIDCACRHGFHVALLGEYRNSEGRVGRRLVRFFSCFPTGQVNMRLV